MSMNPRNRKYLNINESVFKWIAISLIALVSSGVVVYLSWAGISITENKSNIDKMSGVFSLKVECENRNKKINESIATLKADQNRYMADVKTAVEDLRIEQRELIKAVYKNMKIKEGN